MSRNELSRLRSRVALLENALKKAGVKLPLQVSDLELMREIHGAEQSGQLFKVTTHVLSEKYGVAPSTVVKWRNKIVARFNPFDIYRRTSTAACDRLLKDCRSTPELAALCIGSRVARDLRAGDFLKLPDVVQDTILKMRQNGRSHLAQILRDERSRLRQLREKEAIAVQHIEQLPPVLRAQFERDAREYMHFGYTFSVHDWMRRNNVRLPKRASVEHSE